MRWLFGLFSFLFILTQLASVYLSLGIEKRKYLADTTPPTIQVETPTVSRGAMFLRAQATDPSGIRLLTVQLPQPDPWLAVTYTPAPMALLRCWWNALPGQYTVVYVAEDRAGNQTNRAQEVIVP